MNGGLESIHFKLCGSARDFFIHFSLVEGALSAEHPQDLADLDELKRV